MWYVVKHSDTLYSICSRFGIGIRELMQANCMINGNIFIGDILFIPQNRDGLVAYTVKQGDNLNLIAARFNTTSENIILFNKLQGKIIFVGQKLLLKPNAGVAPNRYTSEDIKYAVEKLDFVYDVGLRKNINVWDVPSKRNVIFYQSKMNVSADGAFKAYNEDNELGLNFLAVAGYPGNWWSLVTDPNTGEPIKQGPDDPAPGYYISQTYLSDCNLDETDPHRYVNSEEIPYILIPMRKRSQWGIEMGDLAAVYNIKNKKLAFAEVADEGPDDELGMGSIKLAQELGIDSDPKSGGVPEGVMYIVFRKTGKGPCHPWNLKEIKILGKMYFEEWGGQRQIDAIKNVSPELFELKYSTLD